MTTTRVASAHNTRRDIRKVAFYEKHISVVLLITSATLLSACSLVSGSQAIPLKRSDAAALDSLTKKPIFNVPLITHKIDNHPLKIYLVAFDGTMNDVHRVSGNERPSIVGHIASIIHAADDNDYQPGAGMRDGDISFTDAATGQSCLKTAERSKDRFIKKANDWLAADPRTEIRVFVTGFSRGAATARHFMNIVDREWRNKEQAYHTTPQRYMVPRFYALLYDTVATGQQDALTLGLPKSVDYLVHFLATDEPRSLLFTPTIDVDPDKKRDLREFLQNPFHTERINDVYLPGAHSDIGATYKEGVGDIYITLTEKILYYLGLTNTNCWDSYKDSRLEGKHDSRGILDKLFGSIDPASTPSVNRPYLPVQIAELSHQERSEISHRLTQLTSANSARHLSMSTFTASTQPFSFVVKRVGDDIELVEVSGNVDPSSAKLVTSDEVTVLQFNYSNIPSDRRSSFTLTKNALKNISHTGLSTIFVTYLQTKNGFFIATYVDDILADQVFAEIASSSSSSQSLAPHHCVRAPDGSLRSPIQTMVISGPE